MFHDKVLKTTRGFDVEPLVFRQMQGSTPKLLYECYGDDGHNKYHCWVAERCIPLNQLVNVHGINKENCILAACRCLSRAALGQASGFPLLLSDCHFYNLGARITHSFEHEVVIIDAGSRGVADSVPVKSQVNCCMVKLWKWAKQEMKCSPAATCELWHADHTLESVTRSLDTQWAVDPSLTVNAKTTIDVDKEIYAKCSRALRQFYSTPHCKLIELIGRSAVEWNGGVWNSRMTEICFRAADEAFTECDEEETKVMTELYERITIRRTREAVATRTKEEVAALLAFWWKLQTYRSHLLAKNTVRTLRKRH